MNFAGQVAIVTGAGRGMGRAFAHALAQHGASVALADIDEAAARSAADEICQAGGQAVAIRTDVACQRDVCELVGQTVGRFGRLDVLICNAGICQRGSVLELTEQDWDRMMAVNLKGAFLCIREALRPMIEQRYGRIVVISSQGGRTGGILVAANYCASKAGLLGLVRAVAREVAGKGITVNAVAPGATDTELMADWPAEQKRALAASIPVGRLGSAEDIVAPVLMLASRQAGYITGATLDVNGGLFIG